MSTATEKLPKDNGKDPIIPRPPAGWTRCHAYLKQKRRFCRQLPVVCVVDRPGSNNNDNNNNNGGPVYCGNHQVVKRAYRGKRIRCPIDPSHFIYEDQLKKHILVCPAATKQQRLQRQSYYRHDINAGGHGALLFGGNDDGTRVAAAATAAEANHRGNQHEQKQQRQGLEWAKRFAVRVLQTHQRVFAGDNDNSNNLPMMTLQDIHGALGPVQDLSHPELLLEEEEKEKNNHCCLPAAVEHYKIKSGGPKQLHQLASLLGHLRTVAPCAFDRSSSSSSSSNSEEPPPPRGKINQNNDDGNDIRNTNNVTFLEVGAGRGMLGLVAAGVAAAATATTTAAAAATTTTPQKASSIELIMVERAGGVKSKADSFLRIHNNNKGRSWAGKKRKKNRQDINNNKLLGERSKANHNGINASLSHDNGDDDMKDNRKNSCNCYMNLSAIDNWSRIPCDLAHVDMKTALQENVKICTTITTDTTAAAATAAATRGTSSTGNMDGSSSKHNVKTPAGSQVVVIGKHLCGAGTDLALKSLEPIRNSVEALVMATCCHGVCTWNDYVGRDFLAQAILSGNVDNDGDVVMDSKSNGNEFVDFGPLEFELLRRWSSGTVMEGAPFQKNKGSGSIIAKTDRGTQEQEDEDHQQQKAPSANCSGSKYENHEIPSMPTVVKALGLACGVQGLGRASQRLIDYGRREYLRHVIFKDTATNKADLVYYVTDDVTPQNAALVFGPTSAKLN